MAPSTRERLASEHRTGQRARAREARILEHLPLVHALARRYADRGEPLDDLVQAGTIGLIKAVDRFDPERGTDFRSFAAPTVLGEIRRHFRDHAWGMSVPRSLKDDDALVRGAIERLTSARGHTPTVDELADECGIDEERVLDAMAVRAAYTPSSLSLPPAPGAEEDGDREIASEEEGYRVAESRVALAAWLKVLPARERVIIHLRFHEGLLQSEIAGRVGISQMHVSRLIARSLETLRRMARGPQ
jgi:RNA polymerase sigma-B factor